MGREAGETLINICLHFWLCAENREQTLCGFFFPKVYVPFHLRQDTAEDTFRDTTLMRPAVSVRSSSTVVAEEMKIILKL